MLSELDFLNVGLVLSDLSIVTQKWYSVKQSRITSITIVSRPPPKWQIFATSMFLAACFDKILFVTKFSFFYNFRFLQFLFFYNFRFFVLFCIILYNTISIFVRNYPWKFLFQSLFYCNFTTTIFRKISNGSTRICNSRSCSG